MKRGRHLLYIFGLLVVSVVAWRFGIVFGAVALAVTLLGLRDSAKWEKDSGGKHRHPNERILYDKFGHWTLVLQYGPLALFVVLSIAADQTGDPLLTRLSWGAMGLFFVVGLYLCWEIAAEKHGWNESDEDKEE